MVFNIALVKAKMPSFNVGMLGYCRRCHDLVVHIGNIRQNWFKEWCKESVKTRTTRSRTIENKRYDQ
ncbi:PH domain-containing protein [Trichinella spiralis]|uniref:PH domain-containing protein n=1 Tax=Trichinella spiralis TaxID=6334 RepID=A0ABR3KE87_TRISP